MRWTILIVLSVWLVTRAVVAHAQFGLTLPFGDSGGGFSIGVGGGLMKGGAGGKPGAGPAGGKLSEPKSTPPVKAPQFKSDTPKADLTKTPHKPDLDRTPPPAAGPHKDESYDKPHAPKGPGDTPKGAAAGDGKTTDKAGGEGRTTDKPAGDGKTSDKASGDTPPKRDDRRDDAKTTDKPTDDGKSRDKSDTGVTTDRRPPDSGGAIVIDSPPPSRPVRYVAPLPNALCGPDVTEQVLAVLRSMAQQFDANPGKQDEACRTLVNPFTGGGAWDINGLDPTTGGTPGHYQGLEDSWTDNFSGWLADKLAGTPLAPYGPTQRKWVQPQPGTWLTGIDNACAVPRPYPVCAATVEFLGTCQHAQIVNYAMWGMVMGLCNEKGTGMTHALGEFERNGRNFVKSLSFGGIARKASSSDLRPSTPPDQELMVKVGERYHKLTRGAGDGPPPDTDELAAWLQFEDDRSDHPERACPLHCPPTDLQKRRIKVAIPGFDWNGLNR